MRFLALAVIVAACLPAAAQQQKAWKPPTTVAGKMAFLAEAIDHHAVGKMKTGKLKQGEQATFDFPVPQPGYLAFIAGCIDGCDHLELEAWDDRQQVIGKRTNEYADPIIQIDPKGSKTATVIVKMNECPKDACAFGVNLYAPPGVVMPAEPKKPG